MEIVNDQLKISSTMNVHVPPDAWNRSHSLVFTETTLLNLTDIKSPETLVQKEDTWTTPNSWITINVQE